MEEKKQRKISLGIACIIIAIIAILVDLIISCILGKTVRQEENIQNPTINPTNETQSQQAETLKETKEVAVVPTMQDTISKDSTWCGTFQLVWNDMKNEVVKKDVVFTPQEKMAENLNKEEFTQDMISDEYYYKTYGLKTLELKKKIEDGIKEKFNQTSDILDYFDWSTDGLNDPNNPDVDRYFFYTMLYRKFEFLNEFDKLEKGKFADKYNDVEYFGIDDNTNKKVGDQIEVLYYNSKDDFAITINTKTGDKVTFCKNPQGTNFKQIYESMISKSTKYTGNRNFQNVDEFKAPKLSFNEKREYEELENKYFKTQKGYGIIEKAIQTVKFSLDEKGGEIKSEAAIDIKELTAAIPTTPEVKEPRYFYLDNTFAIFLSENGKSLPYFAGRIEDISKFQ